MSQNVFKANLMRRKWTPTKTFELRDYSPVFGGGRRYSLGVLNPARGSERGERTTAKRKEEPASYPAKSFVLSKRRRHETRDSSAFGGMRRSTSFSKSRGVRNEMKWWSRAARSSSLLMDWFASSPFAPHKRVTISVSFVLPRDNTSHGEDDLECDSSWKAEFMWKSGKLENYSSEFYQTRGCDLDWQFADY